MADMRQFFDSAAGKATAVAIIVVALGAIFFSVKKVNCNPALDANTRTYIDAKTLKPYTVELKPGLKTPAPSPSGNNGYPAELCYWTKDGKPKDDPTPVLLNIWIGKPGPTFCPDCGRLVVAHNPRAGKDVRVPPTQTEYAAAHADEKTREDR